MAKTYPIYLESGPRRKKTMAHVFDLLGCIATGETTDEAVAAVPDAIRAYLRFLQHHGEKVDPDAPFITRIADRIDDTATFIGQGSSYITFDPDLAPVTPKEIETAIARFHAMRETLAAWADSRSQKQLNAEPKSSGRPASKIILHIANASAYLQPIVGTFPGLPSIHRSVERGHITLSGALRHVDATISQRLRAATPAQRRTVVQRSDHVRTMRKALRRVLEHDWEHLSELSRRPGGPQL